MNKEELKMKKELQYVELSPRPCKVVRHINEAPVKAEKQRKVLATIGWISFTVFIVAAFYFFAVAIFTYGASC